MATSRLAIYNGALLICGHREISALTVSEESRRLLDAVWNDGGVRYCLEQGQWNFAMRAVRLDYDPAITPEFGYQRAFEKPTDWVSTAALCSDEYFSVPLLRYLDEAAYWYADLDKIYVKYVSDHSSFGGDLSEWPYSFTEYVKHHFALKIAPKIAPKDVERIEKMHGAALRIAKNKDAMGEPTRFAAQGGWTLARGGRRRWGPMGDGGGSGSLTS